MMISGRDSHCSKRGEGPQEGVASSDASWLLSLSEKGRFELRHASQKDASCPEDQKMPSKGARKPGGCGVKPVESNRRGEGKSGRLESGHVTVVSKRCGRGEQSSAQGQGTQPGCLGVKVGFQMGSQGRFEDLVRAFKRPLWLRHGDWTRHP